ncbi:MAG: hypothetical protein U5O39_07830 [Gammaproteobacteria bacterium]|nr:hypothetical protein [Gammaproteobacteria bacterium]
MEVEITAPDLSMAMDSEETPPVTLYPGQSFPLDLTVSNLSVVDFDDDIRAVVFLSKDEQLDVGDAIVGRLPPASSLSTGSSIGEEVEASIPEGTVSGSYKLLAVANPAAVYAHQRETPDSIEQRYDNNVSVLSVNIDPENRNRDLRRQPDHHELRPQGRDRSRLPGRRAVSPPFHSLLQ